MFGKEMRFQVPPKAFRLDSRITQRIRQRVQNRRTQVCGRTGDRVRCRMCCDETAEYSVCDGWSNGYVSSWILRDIGLTDAQLSAVFMSQKQGNYTTWLPFHNLSCHSATFSDIVPKDIRPTVQLELKFIR